MDAAVSAINMIAQGKRNMVCGEVPTAVNQFQEACKILAKSYGETAKECAEAYYQYGRALLDLARMETGVLGNALQGVPEEEEESEKSSDDQFEKGEMEAEERDRLRAEVYDAMSEQEIAAKKEAEKKGEKDEKSEENSAKKEDKPKDKESEKEESMETDEAAKDKDKTGETDVKDKPKEEDKPEEKEKVEEKDAEMKSEEEKQKKDSEAGQDKKIEGESSSTKNSTEDEEEEEDGEGEEEGEEGGEESEAVDTADEGDKSQDEGSQSGKDGEENPDDISNFQLSWEMLELAKVIFMKEDDKESKLKAADAYLKLGEVSLETEQYSQSVTDFTECLNIQKSVLEPEDRSLAETHYQLGLAYSLNKQYDESIDSYRAAIKVMESRIEKLKKQLEEDKIPAPEEGSFDDPKKLVEKEIGDLNEILPDIRGKIEEVQEERRQIEELKKMAKDGISVITQSLGLQKPEEKPSDEPKKPATDITHLVRRKRKPDEEEEPEAKKTRQEDGAGDATAKVNGVDGDKNNEAMDVDKKKAENEEPKPAEAVAS